MQRDALKPLFTRSKKEDALLPSVVVLPKIGNDRKDSEFAKDPNRGDNGGQVVSPQRPFLGGRRVSKTSFKPTVSPKSDLLAERRTTGFPALSTKPPLLVAKKVQRREKKEVQSYLPFRDRLRSFPNSSRQPDIKDHAPFEEGLSEVPLKESDTVGQDESHSTIDELNAFEDPSSRDFWHYNKPPPFLSRRESVCSSCGGALSYSNSFASTRRFSAVSIEVPNENLTKKSFINRHRALIVEDPLEMKNVTSQSEKWPENGQQLVKNSTSAERIELDRL
eukprot:gene13138-3930_t